MIVITHGIVETLAAGAIIVCVLWFMVMVVTDDWSSDRPEPKMSHASRKLPEHGIPPPERFLPSERHGTKPAPTKAPPPPKRKRVGITMQEPPAIPVAPPRLAVPPSSQMPEYWRSLNQLRMQLGMLPPPQAPPAWVKWLSPEQLKEIAAMGYPVGPTPEMPLRAPETRFYAPSSLTLPDWYVGQ